MGGGRPEPPTEITCVDCGGRCGLTTTWPHDDPPVPGDVLTYRCADCLDRWDVVWEVDTGDGEADDRWL